MKKITLLLLIISPWCNAQNFENVTINYKVSQKERDFKDLKEKAKTSASAQQLLWYYEDAIDVNATLRICNKESIYDVEESLDNDANKKLNLTYFQAGGKKQYYSDTEELFTSSDVTGEYLRVTQEKKEWELLKDTKKIGIYSCFKAININSTSKIKPIAWYTLELPLSYGPREFNGLPGVILELELKNYIFKSTTISINSSSFEPIEKPTKGKKITYAEWRERAKGFFENE